MKPITNRNPAEQGPRFALPADGWIPFVENGETPIRLESGETIMQVVDGIALAAMLNHFSPADKSARIDFDHFSYDPEKSSEAAGWTQEMEIRGGELMARPRWSDTGEAALVNGRFRFISPAFDPHAVEELGRDSAGRRRVRPLRLDSAGLTNNPNMRGLAPLSNRTESPAAPAAQPQQQTHTMKQIATKLGLAAEASEDAIVAEVTRLLNRADTAEKNLQPITVERDALKNRCTQLEDEQIDADLDNHGIKDDAVRAKLKPVLKPMANRTARVDFLALIPKPADAKSAGKQPMTNRATAKTPDGKDAPATDEVALARQAQQEIETYRLHNRCSYSAARNAVRAAKPQLFGIAAQ